MFRFATLLPLVVATPALAHADHVPHAHGTDWVLPAAMVVGGLMIFGARRAIRAKTRIEMAK